MRVSFSRTRPVVSVRRKLIVLFAVIAAVLISLPLTLLIAPRVAAQKGAKRPVKPSVNINTLGSPITQNFDTLATSGTANTWTDDTTLPGWYSQFSAVTTNPTTYRADTGTSNTGAIYSYGIAGTNPVTDRAFGSVASGTPGDIFNALKLTNNTGSTITSLDISYTGEQWRNGGNTSAQQLDFQYQVANAGTITDANTPTTGWTDFDTLDFVSPTTGATAAALDGNAAANRTAKSANLPVTVNNGQEIWLRWKDTNDAGNDHGLAIDDFSVTANGGVATPTLNINDVAMAEGNSGQTAFNFTVSLTAPAGAGGVTFNVDTADGTATTADNDYVALHTTGSISSGNTSTNVTVQVNGDMTVEPNETFFVNISNISGATAGDTQGQGTIQNDDATLTPIYTIQGSGATSPLAGQSVTTSGVVTGIKAGSSGGFFIQDPNSDGNTTTSDGIFVFTGSSLPAGAVITNSVQVSGTVSEFIPSADPNQKPLTELSGTINVVVLATGQTLPAPVTITAADTQVNDLNNLEKYEGMRVSVPSLTVVAPTQGTITEPSATVVSNGVFYGVVTGVARPFREPGINASDSLPAGAPANVPRFDENPERIRVDSDAQPGTTVLDVAAGTVLTNVVGELDYAFRTYTIDPEAASPPTVGTQPGATPAPVAFTNELKIASFNMERFFDTVNDPNNPNDPILTQAAFDKRLSKASQIIRTIQRLPDVIGVEEMENLTTLQAVAAKVNSDEQGASGVDPNYVAYLVEGNDIGGIDVGFLVKQSRVSVTSVTQIELAGCDHVTASTCYNYTNPNNGQPDILNDRPPLVLLATVPRPNGGTFAFTVIVNHLRSLSGIDDPTDGNRIRTKRRAQAEFLANFIQARQVADPTEKIISVGDYNAFQLNDGYVDVIGTIKGTPAPPDQVVLASSDLVNPDLTDLVDTLPADQRYSFSFDGNAQVLDHIIVNQPALALVNRFTYARDDADFPVKNYENPNELRLSDHDQPVVYLSLGSPLIISEFRLHGANGSTDEYAELYNNSAAPLTVNAVDGTNGWTLAYTDSTGASALSLVTIPNGTVIPAHGHFLIANDGSAPAPSFFKLGEAIKPNLVSSGYSLSSYAAADMSYGGDIPAAGALALFQTGSAANFSTATRLDAVSLNNGSGTFSSLFREGTSLPSPGANDGQYAFVRKLTSGTPQDTDNNAADFVFISTNAGSYGGVQSQLGAPGPEDTVSPIQRNAQIKASLIEPQSSSSVAPNRVRDFTTVTNGSQGTLSIRRRFINNTGATVTRLRFRIVDITTLNSPGYVPGGGQADIRAIDGANFSITTSRGMLTVLGTTVEQPAPLTQPNGGGLNSTVTVAIPGGALADGMTIDVHFLLGIQQGGTYRFFINVEALP